MIEQDGRYSWNRSRIGKTDGTGSIHRDQLLKTISLHSRTSERSVVPAAVTSILFALQSDKTRIIVSQKSNSGTDE